MDASERIKILCKEHKISIQKLEQELGEKPTSIATASSNSKAKKLYKIAKYFHVSIEYLLTGEDPAAGFGLSREEIEIIKAYRLKSDDAKDIIANALGVKRQDTSLLVSSKAG